MSQFRFSRPVIHPGYILPGWATGFLPAFHKLLEQLRFDGGFVLQPVVLDNINLFSVLEKWLGQYWHDIYTIKPLDIRQWIAVTDELLKIERRQPERSRIVFLVGTGTHSPELGIQQINLVRGQIVQQLACPLLLCGPAEFLQLFWSHAPNFYSGRNIEVHLKGTTIERSFSQSYQPYLAREGTDAHAVIRQPEPTMSHSHTHNLDQIRAGVAIDDATAFSTSVEELRTSLKNRRMLQDPVTVARMGIALIQKLEQRGDFKQAQEVAEHELRELPTSAPIRFHIAFRLHLARLALSRGDLESSKRNLDEALARADIGTYDRLRGQLCLGEYFVKINHYQEAEAYFELVRAEAHQYGYVMVLAAANQALGSLYLSTMRSEAATARYQEALDLYEKARDLFGVASTQHALAVIDMEATRLSVAQRRLYNALEYYERLGNKSGQAKVYMALGDIAAAQHEEAMPIFESALRISQVIQDDLGRASIYRRIGNLYGQKGDLEEALSAYNMSLELDKNRKNYLGVAKTCNALGKLYLRFGQLDQALLAYKEAQRSNRDAIPQIEAETLYGIGASLLRQGRVADAVLSLQRARKLYQMLDDGMQLGWVFLRLGQAALKSERPLDALANALKAHAQLRKEAAREGAVESLDTMAAALVALGEQKGYNCARYLAWEEARRGSLPGVQQRAAELAPIGEFPLTPRPTEAALMVAEQGLRAACERLVPG